MCLLALPGGRNEAWCHSTRDPSNVQKATRFHLRWRGNPPPTVGEPVSCIPSCPIPIVLTTFSTAYLSPSVARTEINEVEEVQRPPGPHQPGAGTGTASLLRMNWSFGMPSNTRALNSGQACLEPSHRPCCATRYQGPQRRAENACANSCPVGGGPRCRYTAESRSRIPLQFLWQRWALGYRSEQPATPTQAPQMCPNHKWMRIPYNLPLGFEPATQGQRT